MLYIAIAKYIDVLSHSSKISDRKVEKAAIRLPFSAKYKKELKRIMEGDCYMDHSQNQLQEIMDKLEQGVKNVFSSEKYTQYLMTMAKFHNYSLNNILLINMQKPSATLVAGYNAWKKLHGRNVMKGEKGIKILAPSPYKVKRQVEKIDPQTRKPVLDKDGQPVTEEKEITIPAYKVVSVFDVSQTEGKELPTLANELTGEVENFDIFFDALTRACPVPISYKEISSGAKGYFSYADNEIAVKQGMSQLQTVKTTVHEMTHQKLHSNPNLLDPLHMQTRSSKEVEAESVAYVVCQHYEIDTSDYSFSYVAGWSEGKETPELKESLDTIRKAASEMIMDIDKALEEISKEMIKDKKPSLLNNLHKKQEQIKNTEKGKQQSTVKKHNIEKNQREGER